IRFGGGDGQVLGHTHYCSEFWPAIKPKATPDLTAEDAEERGARRGTESSLRSLRFDQLFRHPPAGAATAAECGGPMHTGGIQVYTLATSNPLAVCYARYAGMTWSFAASRWGSVRRPASRKRN